MAVAHPVMHLVTYPVKGGRIVSFININKTPAMVRQCQCLKF